MKKIFIENKEYTVYHRNINAHRGYEYVIFNNSIYRIVGKQGAGINLKYNLVKESKKQNFWIDAEQIKNLLYIVSLTGYISI